MVKFQRIAWKNFLSTGNAPNEIQLDATSTTLIVGENGSGKSTLLDAITFALFGKPFRNINKPQLLNSVNQKNLEVEVEFSIGGKKYKVVRGVKPAIFNIYVDDVLLNRDASVKDYQNILETQILKFNYKSFTQIVILGSASFTPFMQLPSGARREVIEDLLDITIFSTMNRVLKDKQASTTTDLINLDNELDLAKKKAMIIKEYINTLEGDKKDKLADLNAELQKTLDEGERYSQIRLDQNAIIDGLLQKLEKKPEFQKLMDDIRQQASRTADRLSRLNKEIQFYSLNDQCPSCLQDLTPDFKARAIEERAERKEKASEDSIKLDNAMQKLEVKLASFETIANELKDANKELATINAIIGSKVAAATKLQADIKKVTDNSDNIDEQRDQLQKAAQNIVGLMERRTFLNEEKQYQILAQSLLKDSGIKTKIIKQYLPIINKLVNKYLQTMDLFIQFELDEEFSETIKSRHRDEFTYASFSEGEKQRINLALLFAWRTIASLRNTTHTNLLLFDEVLDGSLDSTAVEYFLGLLKELGANMNIFVISHKENLFSDKFERTLKVSKVSGYSVIDQAL